MTKPTPPSRRGDQAAVLDDRIAKVLDAMLEGDVDITHRAVVRAVQGLSAPSSITRDNYRRGLVEYYQSIQTERRSWVKRAQKASKATVIAQLAAKDLRIQDLERQNAILTASHKAMILAVGELGGMAAWHRFFESYDQVPTSVVAGLLSG